MSNTSTNYKRLWATVKSLEKNLAELRRLQKLRRVYAEESDSWDEKSATELSVMRLVIDKTLETL